MGSRAAVERVEGAATVLPPLQFSGGLMEQDEGLGIKLAVERPKEAVELPAVLLTEQEIAALAHCKEFGVAYSEEVGSAICSLVGSGYPMTIIERMEGMPSRRTVNQWLHRYPNFERSYRQARERMADALVDMTLELARELTAPRFDTKRARAYDIAIKVYQWAAERFNPRLYAQRGAVSFVIPVQVNTTLALGRDGEPALELMPQNIDNPNVYKAVSRVMEDRETPGEYDDRKVNGQRRQGRSAQAGKDGTETAED